MACVGGVRSSAPPAATLPTSTRERLTSARRQRVTSTVSKTRSVGVRRSQQHADLARLGGRRIPVP
eukprot:31176-Pelagococcus_subviridis.AAC.38